MSEITTLVIVAEAVVLALGGIITHLAYRASRRTDSLALRRFAFGFGVITLGALFGGGVHQLLGADLLFGVLVQNGFTAVGLAMLAYSLFAEDPGEAIDNDVTATRS
ncbi:MAG: hypothetical protein ABEJ22_06855 [Haloferacaceae archaeon]